MSKFFSIIYSAIQSVVAMKGSHPMSQDTAQQIRLASFRVERHNPYRRADAGSAGLAVSKTISAGTRSTTGNAAGGRRPVLPGSADGGLTAPFFLYFSPTLQTCDGANCSSRATGYQIISGHNRTAAARPVGLKQIPAWVCEMDDDTAFMQYSDTKRNEGMAVCCA
ncbi:MAG: ParB N-terminal domain-containing protein [Acidobacteria bacterium]|nr:ParB N-terminal domain-containing protein [Acidobacteriota bacterium]